MIIQSNLSKKQMIYEDDELLFEEGDTNDACVTPEEYTTKNTVLKVAMHVLIPYSHISHIAFVLLYRMFDDKKSPYFFRPWTEEDVALKLFASYESFPTIRLVLETLIQYKFLKKERVRDKNLYSLRLHDFSINYIDAFKKLLAQLKTFITFDWKKTIDRELIKRTTKIDLPDSVKNKIASGVNVNSENFKNLRMNTHVEHSGNFYVPVVKATRYNDEDGPLTYCCENCSCVRIDQLYPTPQQCKVCHLDLGELQEKNETIQKEIELLEDLIDELENMKECKTFPIRHLYFTDDTRTQYYQEFEKHFTEKDEEILLTPQNPERIPPSSSSQISSVHSPSMCKYSIYWDLNKLSNSEWDDL